MICYTIQHYSCMHHRNRALADCIQIAPCNVDTIQYQCKKHFKKIIDYHVLLMTSALCCEVKL
jgi:hypothetical protein